MPSDGTQLRTFESQFKYVRPLPKGFTFTKEPKADEVMEVDEINGKQVKVYTFKSYFEELGVW